MDTSVAETPQRDALALHAGGSNDPLRQQRQCHRSTGADCLADSAVFTAGATCGRAQ
jgi:hypothetical protein